MRYDACIIGAGAEGLAAAAWLAARGLKVIAVERDGKPGGRCATQEFHPGHFASPYADALPAIPPDLFRAFDLARRGVFAMGAAAADVRQAAVLKRALAEAERLPPRGPFQRPPPPLPWPGEELMAQSLAELGAGEFPGALCDPHLAGSAMALLAGPQGGLVAGGLGRLAAALQQAATEAGAEISCGLEASDIKRHKGCVVGLADGSEIAAKAVISTLDLKRSFLSLFAWNELPTPLKERIAAFRQAPGVARLLVALSAPPDAGRASLRAGGTATEAWRAWRSGAVPAEPPALLRLVSAVDPFLAPDGAATLTVTLMGIPHTPFDGAWTHEKRSALRETALVIAERALPGLVKTLKAALLLVPPDIENRLGLSEGDLWGGELSPGQMLGLRPFADFGPGCPRTPVEGFYLAGPSSVAGPLATCASGVAAAQAVLTDLKAGRLP